MRLHFWKTSQLVFFEIFQSKAMLGAPETELQHKEFLKQFQEINYIPIKQTVQLIFELHYLFNCIMSIMPKCLCSPA